MLSGMIDMSGDMNVIPYHANVTVALLVSYTMLLPVCNMMYNASPNHTYVPDPNLTL